MKTSIAVLSAVVLLLLAATSALVVQETEHAVITQFGLPVAVHSEAGLYVKLPTPIQRVTRLDKRMYKFGVDRRRLMLARGRRTDVVIEVGQLPVTERFPEFVPCVLAFLVRHCLELFGEAFFMHSLFREDNGRPIARLRPFGRDGSPLGSAHPPPHGLFAGLHAGGEARDGRTPPRLCV